MFQTHDDELNLVVMLADEVLRKIYTRPAQDNCKSLALRILGFKFDDVSFKMHTKVAQMYDHLLNAYKGVPCALCDARNHTFINGGEQKITQSNHFCRGIIQHSLIPLLYLHKHYRDFHNLVVMFVNQCDLEGNFNPEAEAPPSANMTFNDENLRHVLSCRDSRNYPSWISACEPICNKVHPFKLESFFYPDLDMIASVTKELKTAVDKLLAGPQGNKAAEDIKKLEEEKKPAPTEAKKDEAKKPEEKKEPKKEGGSSSGRILSRLHHRKRRHSRVLKDEAKKPEEAPKPKDAAEKPKEGEGAGAKTPPADGAKKDGAAEKPAGPPEPKTQEEKMTVYNTPPIFLQQNENSKALEAFKIEYDDVGIDPFESSEFMDLSEALYKSISASAKPKEGAPAGDKAAAPKDGDKAAKPDAEKKPEGDAAKEGEVKASGLATRALKSASIFEKSFMAFVVILISVWNL